MIETYDFDGVDYNWEYPGYVMGKGYMSEDGIRKDYEGFGKLLKNERCGKDMEITMSYYPDSKQEGLLMEIEAPKYVDLMHSMAYDQGGQHSTMELARRTIEPPHLAETRSRQK